jgi:hypothetical protein
MLYACAVGAAIACALVLDAPHNWLALFACLVCGLAIFITEP